MDTLGGNGLVVVVVDAFFHNGVCGNIPLEIKLCNVCQHTRETDSRGVGTTRHLCLTQVPQKNAVHRQSCQPREAHEGMSRFPSASITTKTKKTEASAEHTSPFYTRMERENFRIQVRNHVEDVRMSFKSQVLMQNMYPLSSQALRQ